MSTAENLNNSAPLDELFWEKHREKVAKREVENNQKEEVERANKLNFWLRERDKLKESLSRKTELSGGYTEHGMISTSLVMMYEDFIQLPSYRAWSHIYSANILPQATLFSAWHIADLYAPKIDIMKSDKHFPEPTVLQRGIVILIQEREIEIESNILMLQKGLVNNFTP